MSYSQASPTFPTTSHSIIQDNNHDLFSGLQMALPTPENQHIAFRFLLDAEVHVRHSLPPDSPFLNGSANHDATPLTIAKLALSKILNPAWHPILDECERQMASYANVSHDSQTLSLRNPPEDPNKVSRLWSSQHFSSYELLSSPPADVDDYFLSWSGSSRSIQDPTTIPPPCHLFYGAGAELKHPACQLNTGQSDEEILPASTNEARAVGASSSTSGRTTSTYSSLLPERHCPPFANMDPHFPRPTSPSPNDLSSPSESSPPTTPLDLISSSTRVTPLSGNTPVCDPQDRLEDTFPISSFLPDTFASSDVAFTQLSAALGESCRASIDGLPNTPPPFGSSTPGNDAVVHSGLEGSEGSPEVPLEEPDGERPTTILTQKRKKRTFDRPPGLPLGPWTPSDTTPFPGAIPPRKPRKVRRSPSNGPVPSPQHGLRAKIPCPEPDCGTLLLPKSLNRHLERHSNWTDGKYNAHLYCRYCFAAYSRLDLLIRHQKTDAQCVLLQYKIYWKERQPYLEERLQTWRAAASRAE